MKSNPEWKSRLKSALTKTRIFAYCMAGIPDYDNYVAQQRKHNINAPVMTKLEFLDYCHNRRNGNGRCC